MTCALPGVPKAELCSKHRAQLRHCDRYPCSRVGVRCGSLLYYCYAGRFSAVGAIAGVLAIAMAADLTSSHYCTQPLSCAMSALLPY